MVVSVTREEEQVGMQSVRGEEEVVLTGLTGRPLRR